MEPFARMTCQAVALRRLILVSFLALAGAGCVYTDDSPDTNNVNEAEWGCLRRNGDALKNYPRMYSSRNWRSDCAQYGAKPVTKWSIVRE